MNYIFLETGDSTMNYAAARQAELEDMTMISLHDQQAGRGQRGNSWESEPGRNLTVTLFHTPEHNDDMTLPEAEFRISEATALAVRDTLAHYGLDARLKWPNDVYVGDRKISGILIEHTLAGNRIANSRIGIGLNVNQKDFHSDAPNPVSMLNLLGTESSLSEVLMTLSDTLERLLTDNTDLHPRYLASLWRADGQFHPFRRREDNRSFDARIETVDRDGRMILREPDGSIARYFFKEVEFCL